MSVHVRARRLANASPLIALAVDDAGDEDEMLIAVRDALSLLNSRQLLRCFSVLLDDDPTSETYSTARNKNDAGRRAWLYSWLETGDFWPEQAFDTAYGY